MGNEKKFYLNDGRVFSDLKGLAKSLMAMPGEVYTHHVNEHKNDFASWTKFSLKKEELGKRIDGQISKIELELEVLRHLVHDDKKKKAVKKKLAPKKKVVSKKKILAKKTVTPKKKSISNSKKMVTSKKGSFNFASIMS